MEKAVPDIYNTPIVSSAWDVFWEKGQAAILTEKDTLVVSAPYGNNSAEETQLLKMLAACKISPDQYNIIELAADQKLAWHQLKEQTKATKVLLLGVLPAQLGIAAIMVPHEVNNFDTAQWMPTFSLDQIAANAQLKQHLWVNVFQKVYF